MLGFDLTLERYIDFVGHPRDLNDLRLRRLFGDSFPLAQYHQQRLEIWDRLRGSAVSVKSGARELLFAAKGFGLGIGVATSARRVRAEHDLRSVDLLPSIDVLVCRDDVVHGKPDPTTYQLACERLRVPPSQCLALEDSCAGVASATSAGLPTIMIPDLIPDDGCAERCGAILATDLWVVLHALSTRQSEVIGNPASSP